MAHPDVEKHWPELAALEATLTRLTTGTHEVTVNDSGTTPMSDDEIIDAIRRYEKRNTSNWRQ